MRIPGGDDACKSGHDPILVPAACPVKRERYTVRESSRKSPDTLPRVIPDLLLCPACQSPHLTQLRAAGRLGMRRFPGASVTRGHPRFGWVKPPVFARASVRAAWRPSARHADPMGRGENADRAEIATPENGPVCPRVARQGAWTPCLTSQARDRSGRPRVGAPRLRSGSSDRAPTLQIMRICSSVISWAARAWGQAHGSRFA